jgi:hypothetical protein
MGGLGRCSTWSSRRTSRNGRWAASRLWPRLVRPDGEEWWPATANRWTDTHVLVHWVEDDGQAQDHHYELAWLRAEDVRRFLKT